MTMKPFAGKWRLRVGASVLLLVGFATGQKVIAPWEIPCSEETVKPNFELTGKTRVAGQLKDATGAAFADSKVILRIMDAKGKYVSYRAIMTNKDGKFDLGEVDAGKYRFLAAPNRGFKQPEGVKCAEGRDCDLSLVLRANPTDQPFVGCPLQ
jgi:hypothetical protein